MKKWNEKKALQWRYNSAMASQIISLTIVYSIVDSGADQRKYQSYASLAFVNRIHQNSMCSYFGVFFDLRLNKQLSKRSRRRWFDMPPRSLWRLYDVREKLTLVRVMVWCFQATSHYLSQCWPCFMSTYGAIRLQWMPSIHCLWHKLVSNQVYCPHMNEETFAFLTWRHHVLLLYIGLNG